MLQQAAQVVTLSLQIHQPLFLSTILLAIQLLIEQEHLQSLLPSTQMAIMNRVPLPLQLPYSKPTLQLQLLTL